MGNDGAIVGHVGPKMSGRKGRQTAALDWSHDVNGHSHIIINDGA